MVDAVKLKALFAACGLVVLGVCTRVDVATDTVFGFKKVGKDYTAITTDIYTTEIADSETGVHYLIV